jgi:hypothetical protein
MLRIQHCLDNWLTDGSEVVILTRWPHSTPQKLFFSPSFGTYSCQRLGKPQGLVGLEGLSKLKKSGDLNGSGTHDVLGCSIVPQSTIFLVSVLSPRRFTSVA